MITGMLVSIEAAAFTLNFLAWLLWFHLPRAIDALLSGDIALGEVGSFVAYLFRAESGDAYCFADGQAPYKPSVADPYMGERDN